VTVCQGGPPADRREAWRTVPVTGAVEGPGSRCWPHMPAILSIQLITTTAFPATRLEPVGVFQRFLGRSR